MANSDVARVYASSLVEVGQEKKILDQLDEEMGFVSAVFNEDAKLRLFLTSPGFSKDSKKELVKKVFSQLSAQMINFLHLLIENDRQSALGDIHVAMTDCIDMVYNRKRVTVVSREKLDAAVIESIKKRLKEIIKKEIILHEQTDEKILGGIIIKVDDLVIDGSLAKDLKNIRKNLLNSKVRSSAAYED